MDVSRFNEALQALDSLAALENLSSICAAGLRGDGLPQDWVDDLVNLTVGQKLELGDKLDTINQSWAGAIKALL